MESLLGLGVVACLAGIAVIFSVAVRDENVPAALNAGASLLLVLVPITVDLWASRFYGESRRKPRSLARG